MFNTRSILPLSLIGIISVFCMWIVSLESLQFFQLSPLVIAIFLGIIFGNTVRKFFPKEWNTSIIFASKKVLRLGIILYGFKVTFGDVFSLGWESICIALFILVSTFFVALLVGKKWLKLDTDTTILVGAGSSICGAAAILATESTLKSSPEKSSLAISTIVVFGTISMFLFPFLFHTQILPILEHEQGIFIGATVHEVAQVVGAGNIVGDGVAEDAVIVKMTRVIFLVPFLFFIGIWATRYRNKTNDNTKDDNIPSLLSAIPLFAVLFLVMMGVNSVMSLHNLLHSSILIFDTLLLTMAMFALGLETNLQKMKHSGGKAFTLATVLFIWLIFAGILGVQVFL